MNELEMVEEFERRFVEKYRRGEVEHSQRGDPPLKEVGMLALLDYAIEEVLDLWAYLMTLKELVNGSRKD